MPGKIDIRAFRQPDWNSTWAILEPVFRAGDTYSFSSDISESEARQVWVNVPEATFVAEDPAGQVLGTYFLKPNQPGQGSHVGNCGYVVAAASRGQGIASAMCEHSQTEAIRRGFRALQYNYVVATNTGAVRLWQKHGFEIVGTLPHAFRHPSEGYGDVYVMYKQLVGG
ncbi:MAG: GNAT family N-acetyltransferase [Gammaproteobacteria bacterium]|nr:GNAT family N-acetyltransferase [Gammaproteobacteria bacterium]